MANSFKVFGAISLNLALFNLMPLPIADGGKMLHGLLEKRFKNGTEIYGILVVLVIAFIVLATIGIAFYILLTELFEVLSAQL